ncbi:GNAT family N-acetyltransferase [Brevibacterium sp. 50QC2O2]|uniref:GNAT family N-acetyltransferase n=1 Tax=Brevibacterium TaxID=1696 RepID=UPI00211C8BCD|nr:GNAT family N-acetyltransferase [Brevibacterium sp. 91QC2O2]MCQ9385879.1 GNAT family N-acetyltransferase [Brevibacterium sp. 68QC2CO]MCQ9387454.1 GNAT family N-acetyltransferase [Brevibacterium sp. 50QC2O2]
MSLRSRDSAVCIRPVNGAREYPRLVEIWRSAVDATHDFLAPVHRDQIQSQLESDYLPEVDVYVAERGGVVSGFAGVGERRLEMLFVDACQRASGIGSALLEAVVARNGVTTVDVNEQNTQASEFYRRHGFVVVGRSEADQQGLPYPLLHMALSGGEVTGDVVGFRFHV